MFVIGRVTKMTNCLCLRCRSRFAHSCGRPTESSLSTRSAKQRCFLLSLLLFPSVLQQSFNVVINLFYCCREKLPSRSVGTSTNGQNSERYKALSTCKARKGSLRKATRRMRTSTATKRGKSRTGRGSLTICPSCCC